MTSTSSTETWPRKLLIIAVWVMVWQAAAFLIHNPLLLAGPAETFKALVSLVVTAGFWRSIGSTLLRIAAGTLIGCTAGSLLAAVSARSPAARSFFHPFVTVIRAVPVASFVVLLIIGVGSSLLALMISALVVFPILYEAVLQGLTGTDRAMLEMAQVFRLAGTKKWKLIIWPQIRPFFLSGMATAVGMAWKSGVAAEVIGQPLNSVGNGLYRAKIYLETDRVLAWTIAVIVCAWISGKAVTVLIDRAGRPKNREAASAQGRAAFTPAGPDEADDGMPETHRAVIDLPGTAGTAIKLDQISKSFDGADVLKDISFAIPSGSRVVITGPSGCGKTTLLRLILGLDRPDSGQILFDGQTFAGVRRAGVVFQENRLSEDFSSYENVASVLEEEPEKRERGVLALLGELIPDHDPFKPVRELSGGMKRRTALARALILPSSLLVLDEPFTGLDEASRDRVIRSILKWQGRRTLLITAHENPGWPGFEELDLTGAAED